MIAGIGIDSTEIDRFNDWADYSAEKLKKIFSETEIIYCLQNPKKSAERFAARFATKEAFFKALSQVFPSHEIPFLTICKNVSIEQEKNGKPQIIVKWEKFIEKNDKKIKNSFQSFISITHTSNTATAIIIIEKTN